MATIGDDLRRYDQKRTLWTPYWITSKEFDYADIVGGLAALLFLFPARQYGNSLILIRDVVCQVVTAFSGGTPTIDVGSYTIATEDVTTGGTATLVDADEYIPNADITATSTGKYFAATGDWITEKVAGTNGAPVLLTPADATIPCICAIGAASMTAGAARVLMEIVEVPFK